MAALHLLLFALLAAAPAGQSVDVTLPAWSDDGKAIAVAEKKDGGRRWDISVLLLPEELRHRDNQ